MDVIHDKRGGGYPLIEDRLLVGLGGGVIVGFKQQLDIVGTVGGDDREAI